MATTTTNFGWDIPQSTDLVKDGATAIAALGQDIDTAMVDLKGGTTGQVLAKASGTNLDFSWVAVDPLLILDAKGDLISATAADTPARLAVGTNGQILTADSTASTGLAWATPAAAASGLTFIAKSSASSVSSHTVSNCFTSAYNNYRVVYRFSAISAANNDLSMQLTASGTAATSNYTCQRMLVKGATTDFQFNPYGTDEWDLNYGASGYPAAVYGTIEFGDPQVASVSAYTHNGFTRNLSTAFFYANGGILENSSQYDGFKVIGSSGTFSADFYIYGYQKA